MDDHNIPDVEKSQVWASGRGAEIARKLLRLKFFRYRDLYENNLLHPHEHKTFLEVISQLKTSCGVYKVNGIYYISIPQISPVICFGEDITPLRWVDNT